MLLRRVGRPGLLGLAARTAVVAGTASAVTGAMSRHRQPELETEPAVENPSDDVVSQLERLAALQQQGVLTPAEFADQKAKILAG